MSRCAAQVGMTQQTPACCACAQRALAESAAALCTGPPSSPGSLQPRGFTAAARSSAHRCHAVVHVLDSVLLPTHTIQQVVPFNVAVDKGSALASTTFSSGSGGSSGGPLAGLTGSGGSGSSSTASPTSPSAAAASLEAASRSSPQQAASAPPTAPTAAGQSGCFRSIAAAIDASAQLAIDKTIAFLAGWDFSHPGLNVTLFLPSGWLRSCPCRPPHKLSHAWPHAFTTPWRCGLAMRSVCISPHLLPAPSLPPLSCLLHLRAHLYLLPALPFFTWPPPALCPRLQTPRSRWPWPASCSRAAAPTARWAAGWGVPAGPCLRCLPCGPCLPVESNETGAPL